MVSEVDVDELIRNYRLGYEKGGLMAYVVPRDDIKPLMVRGVGFSGGSIRLYGTRIIINVPCNGEIYGRYLTQRLNDLLGIYALITNGECRVNVDWEGQGIGVNFDLRANEALLIMVRLMRLGGRRVRPSNDALRIMRTMGLEGRLLYSDVNHEIQIFDVTKGLGSTISGECLNEVTVNDWRLLFETCSQVMSISINGTKLLIIYGTSTMIVSRYYSSLGVWCELRRVSGSGKYLVILKD